MWVDICSCIRRTQEAEAHVSIDERRPIQSYLLAWFLYVYVILGGLTTPPSLPAVPAIERHVLTGLRAGKGAKDYIAWDRQRAAPTAAWGFD
jgi:hypothetical protein